MKSIALAALSLMLLGCQAAQPNAQNQPQSQRGSLQIRVQFPKPSFSTQLIRPQTRVIYVAVYPNSLAAGKPLVFGPITPGNPQVRLNQLAAGEQTVLAAAYDSERGILTAGQRRTFVRPHGTSQVQLELEDGYRQSLAQPEIAFLQSLEISLPPADAPQPAVLEPLPLDDNDNDGEHTARPQGPRPAASPAAMPSPEPTPEATPSPSPSPSASPTPKPRRHGGGGGGGSQQPSATPTPTPTPTPAVPGPSDLGSDVLIQDGSDQLDPVTVDSPGGV